MVRLTVARQQTLIFKAHSTGGPKVALRILFQTILINLQMPNQLRTSVITAKHHLCSARIAHYAAHALPTCTAA